MDKIKKIKCVISKIIGIGRWDVSLPMMSPQVVSKDGVYSKAQDKATGLTQLFTLKSRAIGPIRRACMVLFGPYAEQPVGGGGGGLCPV